MFERAELLSKDHYKAQIFMFIHFPNTKQSTTYGKAFGNVAQSFLDSHKKDVFENTETLATSEKNLIEIDFDEGEEELTN
ncbi:hypothetical protein DAPPUDRAFT_320277 [Daphnia pulex]|uniref:Uncharacterized protein n=1 Tax=Daphnia pulex TaxID=6669 RepID=E9GPE4_DAPPU|nr:hypothetical protein DAPPUDRAFT_320277 [Daphnia pulex]|eukprot:EFX78625.1 hypothetical protein DAPPUDRAFT_320277 [Daphnia pulex]